MLEEIFLARERAALSGMPPRQILQDFLRKLWGGAVRRVLGGMPVSDDADASRRRLSLSLVVKKLTNAPWRVASSFMRADTLK